MNKTLIVAVLGLMTTSVSQAGNILATNYDEATLTQRPLSTNAGAPLMTGGAVQLGTFQSADPSSLIAGAGSPAGFAALLADFLTFGSVSAIGTSNAALYQADKSVPIAADSALVGKSIYTLIGNGATLAASSEIALIRDNEMFGPDAPVFAALADISAASSVILIGNAGGPGFSTDLGAATSSLSLAPVPEPMSAMLLLSGLGLMIRRRRA